MGTGTDSGISGGPYQATETRRGVPLSYVAEKLGHCVRNLHALVVDQQDRKEEGASANHGLMAFRYALTSYLALINSEALGGDLVALREKLLTKTPDEFEKWLTRIERAGSVRGAPPETPILALVEKDAERP